MTNETENRQQSDEVTLSSEGGAPVREEKVHQLDEAGSSTGAATHVVGKRKDYLEWYDFFMSAAYCASLRSKDPSTQVGACIVNRKNRIVALGYNGMPNGCSDDSLPWNRTADDQLNTKYPYVCHAEMNAILNKTTFDLADCTCFVLLFPCNECAKLIIQAGITKVAYISDKYHDKFEFRASRKLFQMAGVELVQYTPKQKKIVIDFDKIPL